MDNSELDHVFSKASQSIDEYGCINFLPNEFPDGETAESCDEKRAVLKEKLLLGNTDQVQLLLKRTYILQRSDIIEKNMSIKDLKDQWPHLFEFSSMFIHFNELTGINIQDKLEDTFLEKKQKLLSWTGEQDNKSIILYESFMN